jgi:hypothetical protein
MQTFWDRLLAVVGSVITFFREKLRGFVDRRLYQDFEMNEETKEFGFQSFN